MFYEASETQGHRALKADLLTYTRQKVVFCWNTIVEHHERFALRNMASACGNLVRADELIYLNHFAI